MQVPPQVRSSARLTGFAADKRYPGAYEPVGEGEYKEALALAEAVYEWAAGLVARGRRGTTAGRPRRRG